MSWVEDAADRGLDEPRFEIHCVFHGRQWVAEPDWNDEDAELLCPVCADRSTREAQLVAGLDKANQALRTTTGVTLLGGCEEAVADLALLRMPNALEAGAQVGELRAALSNRMQEVRHAHQ